MKKCLFLIVFVLFSLPSGAKVVDRVMAVVNSDAVTQFDLDRASAVRGPKIAKSEVLKDLIDQRLLEQEVERSKIEVSQEDLAHGIGNVLQQNYATLEQLQMNLSEQGISFEAFKEQLKKEIRQSKFIQQTLAANIQITDEDIRNFRAGREESPNAQTSCKVSWIFFPLKAGGQPREIASLMRKGRKVAEKYRRGKNFSELIGEYSDREFPSQDGSQQTKLLRELPGAIAGAVGGMNPGTVSGPIPTPQGIYVVALLEKSVPEKKNWSKEEESQVERTLYNERMAQEIGNFLLRLRRKAFIEIRD